MKYDAITIIGLGVDHNFVDFCREVFGLSDDEINGMVNEIEHGSGSVKLEIECIDADDSILDRLSLVLIDRNVIHKYHVHRKPHMIGYTDQTPGSKKRIISYIEERV